VKPGPLGDARHQIETSERSREKENVQVEEGKGGSAVLLDAPRQTPVKTTSTKGSERKAGCYPDAIGRTVGSKSVNNREGGEELDSIIIEDV